MLPVEGDVGTCVLCTSGLRTSGLRGFIFWKVIFLDCVVHIHSSTSVHIFTEHTIIKPHICISSCVVISILRWRRDICRT